MARKENPTTQQFRVVSRRKTRMTVHWTVLTKFRMIKINPRLKTLDSDNNLTISILKMVMTTKQRSPLISFYHSSRRKPNAIRPHQLQEWLMEEEKPILVLSLVLLQVDESHLQNQTVSQIWNSQIIALHKKRLKEMGQKRRHNKMVTMKMKDLDTH